MPRHSASKPATYDIITVRWKEDQYKIWRHWVDRTCPTARVHWIPDTKPFPWNWAGGKVPCFDYGFETGRVIYMDTDTIVTHDLEGVFDLMGECKVGASYCMPLKDFGRQFKDEIDVVGKVRPYKFPPSSVSSGMIVTTEPETLYIGWNDMMSLDVVKDEFKGDKQYNEHVLSLALSWMYEKNEIWDIPLEVHGVILGKPRFGGCDMPWVMHYRKIERLRKHGFGHFWDNLV